MFLFVQGLKNGITFLQAPYFNDIIKCHYGDNIVFVDARRTLFINVTCTLL